MGGKRSACCWHCGRGLGQLTVLLLVWGSLELLGLVLGALSAVLECSLSTDKAASEVLGWLVNACRESLCSSNKHFGDCHLYCSHVGKNNYMLRNHVKLSSNLYKIKLKVTEWMLILAVLPLAVTLGLQPLTSFCVQ